MQPPYLYNCKSNITVRGHCTFFSKQILFNDVLTTTNNFHSKANPTIFAKYIIWTKGQSRSFSSPTFLNAFLQNKNIYRVTVLVSVILQNLLDFLASFYKRTITWFDCEIATTWLGNKLYVQLKSSTHLNSFITYLNFLTCSTFHFFRFSEKSLSSNSFLTQCQGGRKARVISPRLGTAFRANFIRLSGLLGWLFSLSLPYGCGSLQAMIRLLEKPTADNIKLTHSEAFWEVTLRFSYLPIHKTHFYSIIGLFRFPLAPPSFWFVRPVLCASNTPYNFHIAHVPYCFTPFRNLTVSTFSS